MSQAAKAFRVATHSIPGRRDSNEDSLLAEALADGRTLLTVADGMGGHAAGEVASSQALEGLREALRQGVDLDVSVQRANERVFTLAREPGQQGMGTTLVAVVVDGDEFEIVNVGDSRAYLLAGGEIRQLTQDHSFVAEAERRGQSVEEAMRSRWKDALTRSVGTEQGVQVDRFGPFPVVEGSALLLCSDGLYKALSDARLLELVWSADTPDEAARTLVSAAWEAGSDDNISVVVAVWDSQPGENRPERNPDAGASTLAGSGSGPGRHRAKGTPLVVKSASKPARGGSGWLAIGLLLALALTLAYFLVGR